MGNKKKKNYALIITGLFFIVFMGLYISMASGYYELKEHNKKVLTKKAMKKFESDIEEGKDIKINDYVDINTPDYTTKLSRLSYSVSSGIEKFMSKGVKEGFGMLGKLFS